VAFRATGLLDMIESLKQNSVDFKERRGDAQGLYRLFLLDAEGVKIALNFEAAEAKDRELMCPALHSLGGTEGADALTRRH
jgi:hypothetical protein